MNAIWNFKTMNRFIHIAGSLSIIGSKPGNPQAGVALLQTTSFLIFIFIYKEGSEERGSK